MKTILLNPMLTLAHLWSPGIALIFCLCNLLSCNASIPTSAYADYAQAVQLYMKGENKEALGRFEKLHRVYPRFTESSVFYGRALFYSEQYSEAAHCLEKVLQNTVNIDSAKILARCYLRLGETAKAEAVLAGAMEYSSEDPELLYLTARCRIASDDTEEALTLLTAACTLMERQIEIPLELAALYSSYGLDTEAGRLVDQYLNILEEGHPLKRSMERLNTKLHEKKMARP
jgi:Flp pilus assembly protein TadD